MTDPKSVILAMPLAPNLFGQEVDGLLKEIGDMLKRKNAAYGNSALDPIRCFSRVPASEQLRVRNDDKISRLMRGKATDNEDTVLDLIGYLVLLRIAERGL